MDARSEWDRDPDRQTNPGPPEAGGAGSRYRTNKHTARQDRRRRPYFLEGTWMSGVPPLPVMIRLPFSPT